MITVSVTYQRGSLFARPIAANGDRIELFCVFNVTSGREERALLFVEWEDEMGVLCSEMIEARTFGDRFPRFDRRKSTDRRQ